MAREYSIEQLAELVGGTVRGSSDVMITGVADVAEATASEATWVSSQAHYDRLADSEAGVVLGSPDIGDTSMPAILCQHLDASVATMLGAFGGPGLALKEGIDARAAVDSSATIGADPAIGPFVTIEAGVQIGSSCRLHSGVFIGRGAILGDGCELMPNAVVLDGCRLGDRVTLHANAVIGGDGFGYYFGDGRHNKIPHSGGVTLGDDVEIGSCSCVDRSKFGFTEVGRGTKIDNLVQVGHNARIGEHCVIAGQTGIAGSVRTGKYCAFGGRSSVTDNLCLGDQVSVGAISTITKNIESGMTVWGYPAQDIMKEKRERSSLRKLPRLLGQIRELQARIEQLEAAADNQS